MAKHWLLLVVAACGGGDKMGPKMGKMDSAMMSNKKMPMDEASKFGALEAGADWKSYTKLNKASFKSETHGGRMVDTYVNTIGLAAFKKGEDMPVGSIVVKTSKDADDGSEGPLFVMEKRAKAWWYAIHWASPPAAWQNKLGGPIYWRSPSPKADYCVKCHDDFVNGLGGVPDDQRAW
jgi:hypothetical protein